MELFSSQYTQSSSYTVYNDIYEETNTKRSVWKKKISRLLYRCTYNVIYVENEKCTHSRARTLTICLLSYTYKHLEILKVCDGIKEFAVHLDVFTILCCVAPRFHYCYACSYEQNRLNSTIRIKGSGKNDKTCKRRLRLKKRRNKSKTHE